ncbi:unnamed protein product [Fraxinus pennsylvanica]|uniref:DYW domain-containing protein n=1 Tax=Fraxinus pennsylvanica TaxID=56036 RepID=A0AAD2E075_9LAMI|nr:unnamed protein product [Fraxinus pennsylvanica]
MASLPSVVVGNTVKLDRQFKKLNPSSVSFQNRNLNTKELDKAALDPFILDFREALTLIKEGNTKVESSFYVPLLQECIEKNSVSDVQALHAHVIKRGSYQDLFLMTFLVNPHLAISVFNEMLEVGGYPTNFTLGIVLNACSSLCDIELGKHIHGYIIKYGIEYDASIGNALCSFYSKCGSLDMAFKAFSRIGEKNVISWTAVISACGDNGDSAMGLDMFVEMLSEGVEPNEFTLTSVLSLCCIIRALGLGTQVHSLSIKLGYGSQIPVTNSIMYLYLKNGCINEAKKLFDGMNNISLVTWNAMIAGHAQMMDLGQDGISTHFSGIEGLKIFQRMKRSGMKPDLYTFSSILTVCTSRWKDVSRVRKLMKDEKIGKMKDWSWISIRNKVFSFKSENQLNQEGEVTKLLEDLQDRARVIGYQLQANLEVVDDAEETTSLPAHHSEKLAVAYGLLNTSNGGQIRIVKSISMCRDCHNFIKFISTLTSRTIIVRDSKRLHKFFNGNCSCGDFGSLL